MDQSLLVRIVVLNPPAGVTFAVQRGKSEYLAPVRVGEGSITFEFAVRVAARVDGNPPNFLGPYAHGTPADRFFYVNSGTLAGQPISGWTRRAKIKVQGITWDMIQETLAVTGAAVEARVHGTARDGGPFCATVPLVNGGWQVSRP